MQDFVNSMRRYYYNNFTDGFNKDSLSLLLGLHRPEADEVSPFSEHNGRETKSLSSILVRHVALAFMLNAVLLLAFPPTGAISPLLFDGLVAAEQHLGLALDLSLLDVPMLRTIHACGCQAMSYGSLRLLVLIMFVYTVLCSTAKRHGRKYTDKPRLVFKEAQYSSVI